MSAFPRCAQLGLHEGKGCRSLGVGRRHDGSQVRSELITGFEAGKISYLTKNTGYL